MNRLPIFLSLVLASTSLSVPKRARGDDASYRLKFASAVRESAKRVLPSVVTVEIIGAVGENAGEVEQDAPTSGIVVDASGLVLASSIVVRRPSASMLVVLPDGTRHPAKVVAKDNHRDLVLLKIKTDKELVPATLPDKFDLPVGSTTIAVGRYGTDGAPLVSAGVLSATERLDGIALQTDARVSPSFYGGPLVDLQGNLIGILIPAVLPGGAPDATSWYDSGIAFAIPTDVVVNKLDRLREGEDIDKGLIGIVPKTKDPYKNDTQLAAVRVRSPAEKAGLKPGDVILTVAGREVRRFQEIRQALGRYDAGESLEIEFRRDGKREQIEIELAKEIPPLQPQRLGLILSEMLPPENDEAGETETENLDSNPNTSEPEPSPDSGPDTPADKADEDEPSKPVEDAPAPEAEESAQPDESSEGPSGDDEPDTRVVFQNAEAEADSEEEAEVESSEEAPPAVVISGIIPGSPADSTLQSGDQLIEIDGVAVAEIQALRSQLISSEPDKEIRLKIRRGDKVLEIAVTPEAIGGQGVAQSPSAWNEAPGPDWKPEELKLPDVGNQIALLGPSGKTNGQQLGLLVLLLNPGQGDPKKALETWQDIAQAKGVAMCAIAPEANERWKPKEIETIARIAKAVLSKYPIEPSAVAVATSGAVAGGKAEASDAMALAVGISESKTFFGVAISNEARPPAIRLKENDPSAGLQLLLPIDGQDQYPKWATALEKAGYPIVMGGKLSEEDLLRWVRLLQAI